MPDMDSVPSISSDFDPSTEMPPRTLRSQVDFEWFYEKFGLYLAPNMPRSRSWAAVYSQYFGPSWRDDIEGEVANAATLMDIGAGSMAVALTTLAQALDRRMQTPVENLSLIAVDPTLDLDNPYIDSRITLIKSYSESIAIEDCVVDRAISVEVWQYIADKPRFIKEVWRTLKQGGFAEIVIDAEYHDIEGTIKLFGYSDMPKDSYSVHVNGRGATILTIHKTNSPPYISFLPYEVEFTGVERVSDYTHRPQALYENRMVATIAQQPYLGDHIYYPRFKYKFANGDNVESLDLWRDIEN